MFSPFHWYFHIERPFRNDDTNSYGLVLSNDGNIIKCIFYNGMWESVSFYECSYEHFELSYASVQSHKKMNKRNEHKIISLIMEKL